MLPGPTELWVILLIVLVLFGGRKIPEIMRGLGKGVKEFKQAKKEISQVDKDIQDSAKENPPTDKPA